MTIEEEKPHRGALLLGNTAAGKAAGSDVGRSAQGEGCANESRPPGVSCGCLTSTTYSGDRDERCAANKRSSRSAASIAAFWPDSSSPPLGSPSACSAVRTAMLARPLGPAQIDVSG